MVEPTPELLVVIAPQAAGPQPDADDIDGPGPGGAGGPAAEGGPAGNNRYQTILTALREIAQVTVVLPPRLALVAAPRGRVDALARLPGVLGVFPEAVPAGLRETLTASENLFVDGWLARLAGKQRSAEGLPWDATGTGRLPPGPPHDRKPPSDP
ncbi:hypothetical protein [Candidatus Protofrankia californiensis]|uniref:hypothetical protein n=1 Tax=Candidatus Protofrankia californiensis TaxID=1839754 RepID=UPI0010418246|nr:hypothetical protein [Candidatus Protofrankia californiensis]